MKTLELETVSGMPISILPDKLTAFSGSSTPGQTNVYLSGGSGGLTVKGSYGEIKEKIKKC